jgi:hypothetical protein
MQNNGAVSWQSKLQSSIALSTAEAEYQSMGKTGKEGVWLHRLIMHDMLNTEVHDALPCMMPEQQYMAADTKKRNHDAVSIAPIILSDSQSAIAMVKTCTSSKKTKHIEMVHHWVRDQVTDGKLSFDFVSGTNNTADIFTKCLPVPRFNYLREKLGMMSYHDFMHTGKREIKPLKS